LTINTDSDLSFMTIQQQTYRRKQLMDQADNNSLTALLTKRAQVRFCKIVNTCTERWAENAFNERREKTLCEHVNGLCPAGWLNEQSITKHWFQSVHTCPYSWATGRKTSAHSVLCSCTEPICDISRGLEKVMNYANRWKLDHSS